MIASTKKLRPCGFSLVELLVVIAVIGVVTLIAVPAIGDIISTADEARDRRNAQNIASVSAAATAAGIAHVIPESLGGVEATVRLLRVGVVVVDGPLLGKRFEFNGINPEHIINIAHYLEIVYESEGLRLTYNGAGNS